VIAYKFTGAEMRTREAVLSDMPVLRDYQQRAVDEARNVVASGFKKIILALPTGAGKSWIMAEIIRLSISKGCRVLWLVHRRNLVAQMRETLLKFGIDAGVIMAGVDSEMHKKVQVGTYQTYSRRIKLENSRFFVDAQVVLIDECHRSLGKVYMETLEMYHDRVIIGCTATPMRSDGKPLGNIYEKIVDVIGVKELVEAGHLATPRYYAPSTVDTSGVKIVRGDYDIKGIEARTNTKKITGDIVDNWLRAADGRPTIVFCLTVKHSISVCEEFLRVGISAAHLDARSSDDERDLVFRKMQSGELTVLCNVALYQEGMDCPNISCVVMARPTKSLGLYRQACGRGLRVSSMYPDCKIFDHVGCIEDHGYLTDVVEWTLEGNEKAYREVEKKEKEKRPTKCSACHLVFEGSKVCPDCGSPVTSFGRKVEVQEGTLEEISGKKGMTKADKRRWYGMCLAYQLQKGYRHGWAAHKYRERTGVWPRNVSDVSPIEPDDAFINFIIHLNIKKAKSKDRGRRI